MIKIAAFLVISSFASILLAQDEIPAQFQTTDKQTLDVMNQQKAELCSPPASDMATTCAQMEQGRQMLLAKMRGEDAPPMSAEVARSAPTSSDIVRMMKDQVREACGSQGDVEICKTAKLNLQLATGLQGQESGSRGTSALSTSSQARPRSEAPGKSDNTVSCQTQVGCVSGRVENAATTSPVIILRNGCGERIFFSLCVNKPGEAAPTLLPGQTAADSESRDTLWMPTKARFTYNFRWSKFDPAPAASC